MIEVFRNIDHSLFHFINHDLANPFLDLFCTTFRDKKFLAFCYCLFAYRIYKLYPKLFLQIVLAGGITFLFTDQLSANFVKHLFHRLRPCNNHDIEVRLLLESCGAGFSFVSAHAANSFGMATYISLVEQKGKTFLKLYVWATLVAFSQVYVGVHFPADALGGTLLGIAVGCLIGFVARKIIPFNSFKS